MFSVHANTESYMYRARRISIPIPILGLLAVIACAATARAMPFEKALKQADPAAKYLFYLHGAIVEQQGKHAVSKRYGAYDYDRIIEHFEDRGLVVIDEVRGKTNPNSYAAKVTGRIRQLRAAGVPSGNITVAGFSKGGYIALLVASSMNDPGLGYVVMAGCGKGRTGHAFARFLKHKRGARLKGRIYSIFAGSDLEAGSCGPAMEQSVGNGLAFHENRIRSGKGHGLFYQPRPEWIHPVARFAIGGS